jgi:hypothetical protein
MKYINKSGIIAEPDTPEMLRIEIPVKKAREWGLIK